MEDGFTIQGAVTQIVQDLVSSLTSFAPRLITAVIAVLLGFLIAKIVQWLLTTLLTRVGFDELLEKAGLGEVLRRIGLREGLSRVLPSALFWLTLLMFIQSAAQQTGMVAIADGITGFFAFLPNIISAVGVVLIGSVFGQFLARAVTDYGRDSGVGYARALGSAASGLVMIVVTVIALAQLNIDTRILNLLTVVVFSGFALGFGLSFGLGTRDTTRNVIAGFYARRLFRSGQVIEMSGERGVLRSITPTQTVLESEGRTTAIPNSVFLDQVVRRVEDAAT